MLRRVLLPLASLLIVAISLRADDINVGDRVDFHNQDGWVTATVTELVGRHAVKIRLEAPPKIGPQERMTNLSNVRPASPAAQQPLAVGQRVEVWGAGGEWQPAVVTSIGDPFIKVRFSDGSQPAERDVPKSHVHPLGPGGPTGAGPSPGPAAPPTPATPTNQSPPAAVPPSPAAPVAAAAPAGDLSGAKTITLDPSLGWNALPAAEPSKLNAAAPLQLRGSGNQSNFESVKGVLAPGGSIVGVVYEETSFGKNNATLERVDLRGRPMDAIALPSAAEGYALSPSGNLAAIATNVGDFHRPQYQVTVLRLQGGRAAPLATFTLPAGEARQALARLELLGDDRMLTHHGETMAVWTLPDAKAAWTWTGSATPTLTADRKLLTLVNAGRLFVLDAATGDTLAGTGASLPDGPAYLSPDRSRALVVGRERLAVIDAATGNGADTVAPPPNPWSEQASGWLDDRYALVYGAYVVDGEQVFVAARRPPAIATTTPYALLGDRVVLLTPATHRDPAKLATVALLTPDIRRQLDAIDPAAVWLLRAGDTVAVQVTTGDAANDAAATQALQQSLATAGYVAAPSPGQAKATLVGSTRREDGKAVEYEGRSMANMGQRYSVTPRLFHYDVALQIGGQPAWQRTLTRAFDAGILPTVREGQSLQQAVDEQAKVDPAMFGQIELPRRIPRPEHVDGVLDLPLP